MIDLFNLKAQIDEICEEHKTIPEITRTNCLKVLQSLYRTDEKSGGLLSCGSDTGVFQGREDDSLNIVMHNFENKRRIEFDIDNEGKIFSTLMSERGIDSQGYVDLATWER